MTQDLNISLGQLHTWLPHSRLIGDPRLLVSRIHTDSRSLIKGDLFVALKGDRFDGHDFLAQLPGQGVAVAIATRGLKNAGLMGLEVANTLQALGQLSQAWRSQFSIPMIAVTGSNGKTTVTQMIASILRAWQGEDALATQGNFNNAIGLPLTLLRLQSRHRSAVVELGMNHVGEIAELASLAAPTVALVNNAQREHQEFLHSVQAVAAENGAVIAALPPDGIAVFPTEDPYADVWRQLAAHKQVLCFGKTKKSDIHLVNGEWSKQQWQLSVQTPKGRINTSLSVAGDHNVLNALAAIACAVAANVPLACIEQGIAAFEPVNGRSRSLFLKWADRELVLIDDSYNANPDSVRAAINVLAQSSQPRLLVLGDMGEVGTQGAAFHAEVGRYAQASGIEHLITLGELSRDTAKVFLNAKHCQSIDEVYAQVRARLPLVNTVLIKGSRFMRMERVVHAIQSWVNSQSTSSSATEVPCS
ncbi:MAG: UDP-N-acetylmuramoyl-tripeptide--D-alanyl-D-alanine ligase [Betaproteobacteria bacterium]|nr:UDP-N-acetylmuramoyl-tripeptide--D-alanyl-D-alanine ligase [Betaproteobacteria bacterium]